MENNNKIRLLIIVGTRPEIIRLSEVIRMCHMCFDTILLHTGQNYNESLSKVFFKDLELEDAVLFNCCQERFGSDNRKYHRGILSSDENPTPGCGISAGRYKFMFLLHIPIFHMEAWNWCKEKCLPEETNRLIVDIISDENLAYSEHARRYLIEMGFPKERIYVTGLPMREVLEKNKNKIEESDILNG